MSAKPAACAWPPSYVSLVMLGADMPQIAKAMRCDIRTAKERIRQVCKTFNQDLTDEAATASGLSVCTLADITKSKRPLSLTALTGGDEFTEDELHRAPKTRELILPNPLDPHDDRTEKYIGRKRDISHWSHVFTKPLPFPVLPIK